MASFDIWCSVFIGWALLVLCGVLCLLEVLDGTEVCVCVSALLLATFLLQERAVGICVYVQCLYTCMHMCIYIILIYIYIYIYIYVCVNIHVCIPIYI